MPKAWTSHYAKILPEHVEVNGPVKVGQARQEADRVRNLLLALLAKKTVYERAYARTRAGPEAGGAPPEGTSKGDVALTALVSRLNNWNPARDHGGAVIDLLRPKDHICNANVKGLQAICWPLDHWNDGRWQKHGPALRQWVCHAVLPAAKTCWINCRFKCESQKAVANPGLSQTFANDSKKLRSIREWMHEPRFEYNMVMVYRLAQFLETFNGVIFAACPVGWTKLSRQDRGKDPTNVQPAEADLEGAEADLEGAEADLEEPRPTSMADVATRLRT